MATLVRVNTDVDAMNFMSLTLLDVKQRQQKEYNPHLVTTGRCPLNGRVLSVSFSMLIRPSDRMLTILKHAVLQIGRKCQE